MKDFAQLFEALDETTKTNEKVEALVSYLEKANDKDKLWAIALLTGKRPKRSVNATKMKTWAADEAGIPYWLFEESYQVVGDMAETISLLVPNDESESLKPLSEWMSEITALKNCSEEEQQAYILSTWRMLNRRERFVFNKLIGGSFRIGVSQKTMVRALASVKNLY